MIRKTILFAAILLTALYSQAQQTVGDWNIFTRFSGVIDNVVDSPDKVYYTSGNRLFSFDKESNETYAYTTRNKLNDIDIAIIKYNPEKNYLFIGYSNGNIDLLFDDGHIVNMSDIKDATLTTTKSIRSVSFGPERIYLGTDFGIVVYNDTRYEVVESGNFGVPITYVEAVGDILFVLRQTGTTSLIYAPLNARHNTLDKFTTLGGLRADFLQGFGDGKVVYSDLNDGSKLHLITYVVNNGKISVNNNVVIDSDKTTALQTGADGVYAVTDAHIIVFDENAAVKSSTALPAELKTMKISAWDGPASVWGADADGLANYSIADGAITVLSDKFKPEGIATNEVFFAQFDNHGALWLGNLATTNYKGGYNGDNQWFRQHTTRLVNDVPEDMSLTVASADMTEVKNEQKKANSTAMFGGCTRFAVDLERPNRYYQGNNLEGLYVIEDDTEVMKFNTSNSPFKGNWGARVEDVGFDPDGNLWVGIWSADGARSPYYVLPKEKVNGDIAAVTNDDWRPSKHLGIDAGNKDMGHVMCRKSPVMFTFHCTYGNPLGVYLTNNTWANTDDDRFFELIHPLDQDGKTYDPARWVCGVEDQRGRVWFGTTMGIVEITNPANVNENTRLNRIKVPRNDGTNFADYLCETDLVYDIAVDNSNRKWIATETSGVYLVSENGDKIIEHFTAENSPLPDNCVLSVACDPNSNKVYFGLKSGLVSYSSTSSPAAEDYSDVYAYPNPVRPDYTGWITITRLMDNSLVKIADAAGNVFYQTRSEGGMVIWDGCDATGNRVKSGVYYVFASQNATGSNTGAVTKILVVN